MLPLLIFTCWLFKASASTINGYGNTTVDYGGEAHYRCTMANPKAGVIQVTWQRLFKDESVENLATYSKRFGQQVNEPYGGKVILTEASLSSTSITLANISWNDESCYICTFNVYPDGSSRKQTCLTVQGISAVNKTYVPRDAPEGEDTEFVFSCSATGKPAPTIEWDLPPDVTQSGQPQNTVATNSDHTFTSSSNITLLVPQDWNGHVDCLLNKGMRGERREKIPFYSLSAGDPKKNGNGISRSGTAIVTVGIMIISCISVAVAVMKRKRLKENRSTENV